MCEDNDHQDYNNNYLSMTKQKRDKIADGCQHQSKKNCMTRIINGQIVDSHYEEVFTKSELFDSRRENRQLLHDTNNIIQNCYENPPIITNRIKPVLLRVVNWFFGGCPEASRRHQEQIDEIEKEEIFKSTNTWLL
ncbi:uncharacterized protein LOC105248909 [Camponotus floridanus]|uniref:uncharacterized protein LOC105248909 n=1 Tax=Camponotus floridanus TaxID=104421 RepID=UPI00097171BA|nr:uncharacterized protein LOC105248909 [Camponotus floridanus]